MNNTAAKLLFIAAALMLVAGIVFVVVKLWLYAVLVFCGGFCCVFAAFHFTSGHDKK